MIELNHPRLSVRRQCELMGLSRSSIYYQPACETAENLHQSLNYQTPAGVHFQQAPAKIMGWSWGWSNDYREEEFHTYIENNQPFIPNYGERYLQGGRISTGFVESTVNYVLAKRFTKRQQMQWSLEGAHLLLQTRNMVLNEELEQTFRDWYPGFRSTAAEDLSQAA